ncbi:O-antigen ligase family protein [Microbulbifer pacificus]|uniref:O-antigen ligase family protein n=1 Tax=Microbulbifer pacificus TaxID=407164 RepID=A0AAU0MXU0_9GAMM|nr:O-antigen ligase family protein [Microbulbifer pacificus]WOX04828.1 O-antigen ligase family protein [Microbulbifer pacificus]
MFTPGLQLSPGVKKGPFGPFLFYLPVVAIEFMFANGRAVPGSTIPPEATQPTSRLERVLFYSLLTLLFWLPIPLGSHRPWAWAFMEVWVFAMMAGWLLSNLRTPRWQSLKPYWPLLAIFGVFQLWICIQQIPLPIGLLKSIAPTTAAAFLAADPDLTAATLSFDPNQTHVSLIKGISYWCILFLLLALIDNPKRLRTLGWVVVLTGTFQAFYGVMLALSGSETTWVLGFPNNTIATGGFRYKNHFGNFLVMCLCLGIGLLIASLSGSSGGKLKDRLNNIVNMLLGGKAVLRLCLAMMVIGLVMSHSRMANTAFFASLSIAGALGLLLIRNKSRSLTILLASLMVIDLMIVGSWFGVDKLRQEIEETSFTKETRDEVNQYGMTLIEQHPLSGTGAGSFYSSFPSVQGPGINGFYDLAHNDYLQFAIEYGVPAALLLGTAVLWSLYHAFVALRTRRDSLMQGLAFATLMAIVAELIMLTTDFHLQAPATSIYFLMMLGLAWKARFMESTGQTNARRFRHHIKIS